MPTSPRSLHPPQSQRPCAHPPVWQQLPDPQRHQCHELLTQVMHGEASQERRQEHQEESHPSATRRLRGGICAGLAAPTRPRSV